MNIFKDRFGILHHRPVIDGDAETSENGPLFSGEEMVLRYFTNEINAEDKMRFINICNELYFHGTWRTTPISKSERFSKDNFIGIFIGLNIVKRMGMKQSHDFFVSKVPVFHKAWINPAALMICLRFKYKLKMLDPLMRMAAKISYRKSHKTRGKRKIAVTDGKIMWLMIYLVLNYPISDLRKYLTKRHPIPYPGNLMPKYYHRNSTHWIWGSFTNLFRDYFNNQENHPLIQLISKWER